jgi:hypothetical protein
MQTAGVKGDNNTKQSLLRFDTMNGLEENWRMAFKNSGIKRLADSKIISFLAIGSSMFRLSLSFIIRATSLMTSA